MVPQQINRKVEVKATLEKMNGESRAEQQRRTQQQHTRIRELRGSGCKVYGQREQMTEMSLEGIYKSEGIRHSLSLSAHICSCTRAVIPQL